ncbi:hypothetical protein M9H77_35015 [Catharanthus roseus]|uniref:Uncharacterized protein n=1 Tax=Catharanthus roseus TaxID=4058 RepID=A0ACB9ZN32_CATRO|nr:hypothetical protein M9H77_35015 [Catharanthus roseus]
MLCFAKGVLSPILPEDPGVTLTLPPEVEVTKERKKTNSTKRDKSHWKHVSIAHRKIQKSSGSSSSSGSGAGSGSGSGSGPRSRGRGRPSRAPRGRDPSPCSTFPYTNAFSAFIYSFISNWKNVIGDGNCDYQVVADFLQMHDECLIPPLHVQWIYHRSERVCNWADLYYKRIADWNTMRARNRNLFFY